MVGYFQLFQLNESKCHSQCYPMAYLIEPTSPFCNGRFNAQCSPMGNCELHTYVGVEHERALRRLDHGVVELSSFG
jgi:hypothetical protein